VTDQAAAPLADVLVAELGRRPGAAACGSVLAELGATVVAVVPEQDNDAESAGFAVGKLRLTGAPDDDLVRRLVAVADVVLLSSDFDQAAVPDGAIVCDLTAFGASGPMAGKAYSETQIQAMAGIMETTGQAGGPPVALGAPVIELSTGLYAAAAVLAALRVRRLGGPTQHIDMALYDVAVASLTTFLPAHYGGVALDRLGNAHSLVSPWNAYRAADGWVLICCPSEAQWQRLCQAMDRPDLLEVPAYADREGRIAARDEIDAAVEGWTSGESVASLVAMLSAANIPSGPIVTVADLDDEPNLLHRRMVARVDDPVTGATLKVPGAWLKSSAWASGRAMRLAAPDADRGAVGRLVAERIKAPVSEAPSGTPAAPLAGLRVLEIGQYTTAPLVARHLASLGAEVTKIEPAGGDPGRGWAPAQAGLSYFFVFSNSDKESLALDLADPVGAAAFRDLVRTADVLVENMKPGALGRLGFPSEVLAKLNPRLVYCAISGFGAESAYPGRAAVDTIAQAMSGLMDLTRDAGVPLKTGISSADIVGGQCGLVAILAALECRDRHGVAACLDLAMQDVAAWLTQGTWNRGDAPEPPNLVRCRDGYLLIEDEAVEPALSDTAGLTRAALAARLTGDGIAAVPVATVAEVVAEPQTTARGLIVTGRDEEGRDWPLLASPLRLSETPARVAKPPAPPRGPASATDARSGILRAGR
jgi:crotonobetainyl-CoA:carnitine CoA-transferase CaiB-like acyl-CoA transferase